MKHNTPAVRLRPVPRDPRRETRKCLREQHAQMLHDGMAQWKLSQAGLCGQHTEVELIRYSSAQGNIRTSSLGRACCMHDGGPRLARRSAVLATATRAPPERHHRAGTFVLEALPPCRRTMAVRTRGSAVMKSSVDQKSHWTLSLPSVWRVQLCAVFPS